MQSIFFGKDLETNDVVSVFDVRKGLGCNCVCIDCGKPLIAHQGDKKSWHFQHESYNGCKTAEETSLHLLGKKVFSELSTITLPEVSYLFGDKSYSLKGSETIKIDEVKEESIFNSKFRPDILIKSGDDSIFVELCVTHKSSIKKIKEYRKLDCKALEIKLNEKDYRECDSIEKLLGVVKNKIISSDYEYTWLSHPDLNKIINLLEDKGVSYSNSSGLDKVYCPQSDSIVLTKDCEKCPFKLVKTRKELKCRGNLSREELMSLDLDVVFPPENINYAGKCANCGSVNTRLENLDGVLHRVCDYCGASDKQRCPLCYGVLSMKENKDVRFSSFGSKFIGCDYCSFTLTYKTSNGDFADEVKYTGGLDRIHEDKRRYTIDLINYRKMRKR